MENEATINTAVGGGAYDHLGLVLTGQRYIQLTGVNFALPDNPGPVLAPPHSFMGPAELENLCITHRQQLTAYQKYNQLLAAVNNKYTKALKQSPVGYTNRTTFEVLQHVYGKYGHITPAMLQSSYAAMNHPYNPPLLIEDLFDQINAAQDLATDNGTSYSELQLVSITFVLIFQQGVLNDACKEWRRRPPTEHTWVNFQDHFTEAHRELNKLQTVAHQADFTANMAELGNISINKCTAQALADLISAMEEDMLA
eukprot:9619510-Ditylum_brightwellii.AAC.1